MRVLIKNGENVECLEIDIIRYRTDIIQRTPFGKEKRKAIEFPYRSIDLLITEDIDEEEGKRLIREINEKGFLDLTKYQIEVHYKKKDDD